MSTELIMVAMTRPHVFTDVRFLRSKIFTAHSPAVKWLKGTVGKPFAPLAEVVEIRCHFVF